MIDLKSDKKMYRMSKQKLEKLYNNITDYFDNCSRYGLELREGQYDMALSVYEAIDSLDHLVIEAGVGIGKSFAYLIPLMYYYSITGKSFIISTSTIALQEQLEKDINMLSKQLNIPIDIVVAKGMSNFVCLNRLKEYSKNNEKILELVDETKQDRKDYPNIKDKDWNNINVRECSYSKCSNCKKCEFYKRREQMKIINGAIICNHDLLIEDLSRSENRRKSLFQKVNYIVCDEAHNLESKVRNAKTKSINIESINNLIGIVIKTLEKHGNYNFNYDKIIFKINLLSRYINDNIKLTIEELKNKGIEIEDCNNLEMVFTNEITRLSKIIEESLINIYESLCMIRKKSIEDLQNMLEDKIEMFNILSKGENSNYLFWVEKKGKNNIINYAPKEINKICYNLFFRDKDYFYNEPKTFIFTSATLSTKKDDFSYFAHNIGIDMVQDGLTIENSYQSPYDYDNNAMLYCCNEIASPKEKEKYLEELVCKIKELIKVTKGKSLVLFTSKSDMNYVYKKIGKKIGKINIYIQNDGSSQDVVKEKFKNDIDSCLFSTGAFWEGIDIKGISLSNLIIARLPFPVVDPIMEYKKSLYSENGFAKVYIPEMLIKLKQGIGRLIRSEEDKGIVCILDSRLNEKYQNVVKQAIPIKNFTNDINELKKFVRKKRIKG